MNVGLKLFGESETNTQGELAGASGTLYTWTPSADILTNDTGNSYELETLNPVGKYWAYGPHFVVYSAAQVRPPRFVILGLS